MYLAENLKFLREQNGKTQGELAVLFGIEQKTITQSYVLELAELYPAVDIMQELRAMKGWRNR